MNTDDDGEEGNGGAGLVPRIGEYEVVVLDDAGQVAQRFHLQTKTAFPAIGTGIDVLNEDGTRTAYRVHDVRHPEEETETYSQWRFTGYVAIVRKDDRPSPSTGRPRDTESTPQKPPSASANATVIEFSAYPPVARAVLGPFFKLVAWAVWEGYREQAQRLENLKFAAWQLQWDGRGWLLSQIAQGRSAGELRELSRLAKRNAAEALSFVEQLRSLPAADDLAEVISLDAYRGAKS